MILLKPFKMCLMPVQPRRRNKYPKWMRPRNYIQQTCHIRRNHGFPFSCPTFRDRFR